jgi:hypothetical protein
MTSGAGDMCVQASVQRARMLNPSIDKIYGHGDETIHMQWMNALPNNKLVNGDVNNTWVYIY